MMMIKNLMTFAVAFMCLFAWQAEADDKAKKRADRKASRFMDRVLTVDSIVKAVEAQNSSYPEGASRDDVLADIQKKDKAWRAWHKGEGAQEPFIKEVLERFCSQRLQLGLMPGVTEVFVVDKMGANVCVSTPTSDYDQGDEDKWIIPITGVTHMSEPEKDESSNEYQMQVSYPLKAGDDIIGTMTIGVKVY